MTQQQLGDKIGIEARQIQNYETGANGISASHLRDIAAVMELPVSFFFEGLARALGEAA
jgi:transcriptional regulator with XRE-family HTH domain